MNLDLAIEAAVALGELEGGVSPTWLRQNGSLFVWGQRRVVWNARWTAEEDAFIRANMGTMTDEELGAALGRSANAVKIRRVRAQLGSPSKQPGILTGNGVAKALGVDIHAVMRMQETGRMQCRLMAGERGIMLIPQVQLYMWAIRPENWVCFRLRQMGDRKLARIVALAQAKWTDEWWTVRQVAEYHGVDIRLVTKHICKGWLPAQRWGNHYVLRSVAMEYDHFVPGKGRGWRESQVWPARADEFMLLASAAGFTVEAIARMMKWNPKRTAYRLRTLKGMSK
jgi:hypothetical protein